MKQFLLLNLIFLSVLQVKSQQQISCYPSNTKFENINYSKSINNMKIVRVNFHFMLKSDGTGNFTEFTDGDGRNYSGYQYARDHVAIMNNQCGLNPQTNLPIGNTLPNLPKNYRFVLDAVYFRSNDSYYNYGSAAYATFKQEPNNVINIFFQYGVLSPTNGTKGDAGDLTTNAGNKFVNLRAYWPAYIESMNLYGNPNDWARSTTTSHELLHALTLGHTVFTNGGNPCNNGCNITNSPCTDDGCTDTPTAIEVMQANNCSGSPSCNFGGTNQYCSNNLMDYQGDFALTPCQIGRVHSALEGGLRTYLSCYAVNIDQTFCYLGYPKVSYFGKDIIVGNCGTLANITNQEKIDMYFSSSVELNNFEVRTDSEFEIILEPVCGF